MTTPTYTALTLEEMLALAEQFNAEHRNELFAFRQPFRTLYEPVWNGNRVLRSQNDDRAGSIADFYTSTVPSSPDGMFREWASIPTRTAHLNYTSDYVAEQIEANSLPTLGKLTPKETALIVSAHYLIDRSFNGFEHERNLYDFINSHGDAVSARFAPSKEDYEYGYDLFVEETGFGTDSQYGVQVKPETFFSRSSSNYLLIKDRKNLFSRIRKTEKYHGIQVKWHVVPPSGFDFDDDTRKLFITTDEAFALVA